MNASNVIFVNKSSYSSFTVSTSSFISKHIKFFKKGCIYAIANIGDKNANFNFA